MTRRTVDVDIFPQKPKSHSTSLCQVMQLSTNFKDITKYNILVLHAHYCNYIQFRNFLELLVYYDIHAELCAWRKHWTCPQLHLRHPKLSLVSTLRPSLLSPAPGVMGRPDLTPGVLI